MGNERYRKFQSLITVAGLAGLLCSPWLSSSGRAANALHRYTFNDGTINDSVGTAHGTLIDPMGIAGYNAGRVDLTANDWKGGGDPVTDGAYVDLPGGVFSGAASAGVSGAVSVETWVNVQENRENARIWSFGDSLEGSGENTDWVDLNGQNFGGNLALTTHERFQVFNVSELQFSGTLPTGQLHHVVATLDNNDTQGGTNFDGTMRMYVNNVEVGSQEIEFIDLNAINDVNNWLGRDQWGDWLFDGQIDEVTIYDDALTASEVAVNFAAGPVPTPLPTFVIDRGTGEIRVENQTAINFNLTSYSITSAAGALDAIGWTSITENVGFDPGGVWDETAATVNELAEGTTGDGGQVAATTGSWSLGMAWLQSPTEDLQATFQLSDGSTGIADVSFIGNGGVPLSRGDLNGDGAVDVDDWGIFLAGSDTVFTDVSGVQAYLGGDLNGDFANDFADFRLFQSDYNAANGEGALSALLGQVPEPASLALLAMGLAGLALVRRGRRLAMTTACVLLLGVLLSSGIATAATPALYVASDDPSLDPDANDGSVDAWTVTLSADGGRGSFLGFGELAIGDSWAMYSYPADGTNGSVDSDHTFAGGPLSVGQSIQLDFANSWVAEFGSVGVSLTSGGTPLATLPTFKYVGEDPEGVYRYDDAGGVDQSTGEPYADRTPNRLEIALDTATTYTAAYGASSWNGTYSGTVDGIRVFNHMGGDRSDVIFNNLEIGQTTLVPLSLEVDKSTGGVQIKGNPTLAAAIDYYQIVSDDNALNPVLWDSLDEGDSLGEGWDASPNVSESRLTEYFLLEGGATLDAGNDLPLGKAYDTTVFGADDGDLQFFYGIAGGARLTGSVTYVGSPTVNGDYNNSGQVEQGDLDLVLLNWGSEIPPDTVPDGWVNQQPTDDGKIDQNDLDGVLLNWGNTSAAASAATVPEPSAAVLLALGLLAVGRTRSARAGRK